MFSCVTDELQLKTSGGHIDPSIDDIETHDGIGIDVYQYQSSICIRSLKWTTMN